jgi:hypothetical protein
VPATDTLAALHVNPATGLALTGTVLTFVGLPGLMPFPWWQTLTIFAYAMVLCLVVNDAEKVMMIKWLILNAVARKPVDLTPPIAKPACEPYMRRGRQDGRAVQDWGQAEREIRKDEALKRRYVNKAAGAGERTKVKIHPANLRKPL